MAFYFCPKSQSWVSLFKPPQREMAGRMLGNHDAVLAERGGKAFSVRARPHIVRSKISCVLFCLTSSQKIFRPITRFEHEPPL